jgi:hypothetical protein
LARISSENWDAGFFMLGYRQAISLLLLLNAYVEDCRAGREDLKPGT